MSSGPVLGLTAGTGILPAMPERPGFRYWREPLCLGAAALYLANSVWWKSLASDPTAFVHCYFGDVLCLPVCVPVTLWLQRCLGLRGDDRQPTTRELVLLWGLWSLCFEWLGPHVSSLAPGAVSDPWDAVAYGVGGVLAALVWRPQHAELSGKQRWGGDAVKLGAVLGRLTIAVLVALVVLSAYRFAVMFRPVS